MNPTNQNEDFEGFVDEEFKDLIATSKHAVHISEEEEIVSQAQGSDYTILCETDDEPRKKLFFEGDDGFLN